MLFRKKYYVGCALRERSALFYFLVDIASFAGKDINLVAFLKICLVIFLSSFTSCISLFLNVAVSAVTSARSVQFVGSLLRTACLFMMFRF